MRARMRAAASSLARSGRRSRSMQVDVVSAVNAPSALGRPSFGPYGRHQIKTHLTTRTLAL